MLAVGRLLYTCRHDGLEGSSRFVHALQNIGLGFACPNIIAGLPN